MENYQELANAIIIQAVDDITFYLDRKEEVEAVITEYPGRIDKRRAELEAQGFTRMTEDKLYVHLLNKFNRNMRAKKNYVDALAFLKSEWYKTLTDVDAEYILQRLGERNVKQ